VKDEHASMRRFGPAALTIAAAAGGALVSVLAARLRAGRERAEAHAFRAERLQAVAAALSAELTAAEAAEAVLREGIDVLGGGKGVITLLDPGGETLSIVTSVGYDTTGWGRFEHFPIDAEYPISEAVRLHEPIIIRTSEELKARYPSLSDTIHDGGSALVLPLLDKSRPIGGLYYRFTGPRTFGPDDRDYFMALGRLCAAALERARLHDLERRTGQRAAFLAEASATLAGSLDFEATVEQVAELTVPAIADYCSVHLLESNGSIRTIALAGPPENLAAARRFLEVSPPAIGDPAGIGAVIRDGRAIVVPRVTDEMLAAGIEDPVLLEAARGLEVYAHLSVPLRVGGHTIGALALTTTTASGRSFEPDDLALAGELASRAALAIENARLYSALAERATRQAAVARLGQLALTEQELGPLFEATVGELATVLEVELAKVLEFEPEHDQFTLRAGVGLQPGLVGNAIVPGGLESQAGFTLQVGGAVVVEDLASETRFMAAPLLVDHNVVSGMTSVITGKVGPWGVLGVHSTRHRRFTQEDANFLLTVSNVLAGAIERRRRLDEERQAQDINRAFIGVVSHELRTPITTIYGGAKVLRALNLEEGDRASIVADVEADAERLYRLTEDLLVMTRLERHDLEVVREPVLLSRLVERVVASEQKRWPLVKVRVRMPRELDPVVGEDNYVEQVVRNLLANAAKYSPKGATVEVSGQQEGEEVVVRMLDRGPGIQGEDPDRLFALFYRAPATAQQASGAGIGLFVTDQLVRAMGGRLWAKPRKGGGSEFGFALRSYPVDEEASAASDDLNGTSLPANGSPTKVKTARKPAPRSARSRAGTSTTNGS
jgi:GAF domain-containing protein